MTPAPVATPAPVVTPIPDDGDLVIIEPPLEAKVITLAGSIFASKGHQYDVKLCSGNTCDSTVSDPLDGSYSFDVDLTQWPEGEPAILTAAYQENKSVKLSQSFDSFADMDNHDINDDQLIDSDELAGLLLSPFTLAFEVIAAQLHTQNSVKRSSDESISKIDLDTIKQQVMTPDQATKVTLSEEQINFVKAEVAKLNT